MVRMIIGMMVLSSGKISMGWCIIIGISWVVLLNVIVLMCS